MPRFLGANFSSVRGVAAWRVSLCVLILASCTDPVQESAGPELALLPSLAATAVVPVVTFTVISPAAVAGQAPAATAAFGPQLFDQTGPLVPAGEGCSPKDFPRPTGEIDVIALVERGTCNFTVKVLNAQLLGFSGVVVFDNQDQPVPITMLGTDDQISIPSIFITRRDGLRLLEQLTLAETVIVHLLSPLPDPNATPPGDGVNVSPTDQTTGQESPIDLVFDNVTGSGTTTVTSGTVGGGNGPRPPANFRLGSPPTFYDIVTTATYNGTITVCLSYAGVRYGNESKLKLLHEETDASGQVHWVDVTTSLDTENDVICGEVTSLSPFLAAEENAAPVVTGITLPAAPIALGATASLTAGFTDANPADAHTATINWGTGTSSGTVIEASGSGTVSGDQTYLEAGVYTVSVSVSDGDLSGSRASAGDVPAYIVVYDPSAGFVTGGGWITSPAGACQLTAVCGDATGKASFGFVARYKKGATVPSGNTEFQFHAGDLKFQSTSYEWLVVAGSKAKYKGEGQINGQGRYGFLLTALDGSPDQFRIKIWDQSGGVVYDNKRGEAEDSDAATAMGGGSIVIHR